MGFFDRPEPAGADEDVDPDDPMEDLEPGPWIAGVVGVDLLVAQSDEAVVLINRLAVFPDGVDLWVESYVRRGVRRGRRARRFEHPMMLHDLDDPRGPVPDAFLRFGVSWPDGKRATNLEQRWTGDWEDLPEETYGLEPRGGGGSDRRYEQQYWLWPIPATGELSFVVEWPAYNIPETVKTIDAQLLLEAAERAHSVWPEDADRPSHLNHGAVMRAMKDRPDEDGSAGGMFVEL